MLFYIQQVALVIAVIIDGDQSQVSFTDRRQWEENVIPYCSATRSHDPTAHTIIKPTPTSVELVAHHSPRNTIGKTFTVEKPWRLTMLRGYTTSHLAIVRVRNQIVRVMIKGTYTHCIQNTKRPAPTSQERWISCRPRQRDFKLRHIRVSLHR